MAYNRGVLNYRMEAVVSHEPYYVEHGFPDDRLPAELQRSGQQQRWEREKQLGSGTYGVVWLERLQRGRATGPTVRAVKTVQKAMMRDQRELIALSDFSTQRHVRSGRFVEFYGWFEDPNTVYIAMEYFPLGALNRFIRVDQRLQENEVRRITAQLLLGLADIHDQGYAHRDLKPENIFIDEGRPNWTVKIGDFGISKHLTRTGTEFRTGAGTPVYKAPEIQGDVMSEDEDDEDKYTNKVDLWSLGCVVFEMAECSAVFPRWPCDYKKCCRGKWFPTRPVGLSEVGWEFIKSILVPDPRQRFSAMEALRHDWITSAGPSAGNRGTADLLMTARDTDAPETSILPSLKLPDHSLRTGNRVAAKESTFGGRAAEVYPKPTESASSSKHNSSSSAGYRKPVPGVVSPTPGAEIDSISYAYEDSISKPEIDRSQNVAADYIPVPREHMAKHDIYPTRESESKNHGPPRSDRTWLALAEETFKKAEKVRNDLIQLETRQSQFAGQELKDLNREYANFARLASGYHSQHDYPKLNDVNQKMLELSRNRSRRHPMPPYDLELGCLNMIAAIYEEQEMYDQASAVYEEVYWRQNKNNRIPGSARGLETRNQLSAVYWKQKPNLTVTVMSAKGMPQNYSSLIAYIVLLEITQPIIPSSVWRTAVATREPNTRWNNTFHVRVHQESTLDFNLYGRQGDKWVSQGISRLRVGDLLDLTRRRTVELTRNINGVGGMHFLLSFSTDFDPANAKITPTDNRRFKGGQFV